MPDQITIVGSRTNPADDYRYQADVTSQGAVAISGVVSIDGFTGSITIGSVSANVDLGSVYVIEDPPTSANKNNPAWEFGYIISGTATGVTGSSIGSIVQFIGAGSYVQSLSYTNDLIVSVGSWV